MTNVDPVFRILVVGSSNVGKSSIVRRYTTKKFKHNEAVTVGINAKTKVIDNGDEMKYKLQIWDTPGDKDFGPSIWPYIKGAQVVIFVFALDDRMSFEDIPSWVRQIDDSEIQYRILVGNKADLESVLNDGEIQNYKKTFEMIYYETSAKSGKNIEALFETILYYLAANNMYVEVNEFDHDESIELLDEEEDGFVLPKIKKVRACCVLL